jgi:hypothetical protein
MPGRGGKCFLRRMKRDKRGWRRWFWRSGSADDAADFDFGPAEIDQQAEGLASRPQVIPVLRDMHVTQRANHLGFDDDLVLDQEVGGKFANNHLVVKDHDSPLLDGADPALSHRVGKGISETFSMNP